jgi:hypothetical protein
VLAKISRKFSVHIEVSDGVLVARGFIFGAKFALCIQFGDAGKRLSNVA